MEEQLSRRLAAALGVAETSLDAPLSAIRNAIPEGGAVVDFGVYSPHDFRATGRAPLWGPPRYRAIVASRDASRPAAIVDLGPASEIDELVLDLAGQMQEFPRSAMVETEGFLEAKYRRPAEQLHQKLLAPLTAALAGARKVFLCPDGPLHNVPFESLVDDRGRYLLEADYEFAYLNGVRDLLRPAAAAPGDGVWVFAGPNYNLPFAEHTRLVAQLLGASPATIAASPSSADPADAVRVAQSRGGPLSRGVDTRLGWRLLPGADLEGQDAASALGGGAFGPVDVRTGDEALEELVKRVRRPRVLVLVTHGDFLADEPQSPAEPGDSRGFAAQEESRGGAGLARAGLRATEDPLLRSYLVFAGANKLDEAPSDAAVDNGWLTAQEIGRLDLRGTDLVVLSACNTSRGKTANGQAVMGMRTALLLAGARTIVGSLYEVPNAETRSLMKPFYAGVAAGRGKLAALDAAKRAFVESRREKDGAAHPFYWASFVLVGEP